VVRVAPRPEWVALLGAARSTTGSDGRAVVLDGGGSSIKRGVALIRDQQLAGVHALPPLAVTSIPPSDPSAAVAPTVAALVQEGVTEVVFSVASYVRDGRPIAYRSSIYEQLDPASVRLRLGVPVRVIHDGTAAWRGTGTGADAPSAVITLGTWLGVGIGPQREVLRPYAEDFVLQTDAVPA
jgi:hypothetical protein